MRGTTMKNRLFFPMILLVSGVFFGQACAMEKNPKDDSLGIIFFVDEEDIGRLTNSKNNKNSFDYKNFSGISHARSKEKAKEKTVDENDLDIKELSKILKEYGRKKKDKNKIKKNSYIESKKKKPGLFGLLVNGLKRIKNMLPFDGSSYSESSED